jgi:DNA polymerase (family 10)
LKEAVKSAAPPPASAEHVSKLLREFGQRTALRGGNPYRARAYQRAAESLAALTHPLDQIIAEGRLQTVPGVGPAIADIIEKLSRTRTHPTLEVMREEVPSGVLDLLSIPGLRPEKALKIHQELGISGLDELEQAAREGRLAKIKGLGPALERKILQGLEMRRKNAGRRHLHRAADLLAAIQANLQRSHPELDLVVPAGDYRRGSELVSDLSLVAKTARLEGSPAMLKIGEEIAIFLTDKKRFGVTLLLATGSESHVRALQAIANRKGMILDAEGLKRGNRIVASSTEEKIYETLGLQYVEPELREGRGELDLAAAKRLPVLVRDEDIRGILHAHTDRSDGAETLEAMAAAVRGRGYEYFGIADHSQSAAYAGGLTLEEIEEQHAEIDCLNADYRGKFRAFKGIESDILADGSLDYPDEVLSRFDFVVASVHSRFKLQAKEQTARILRAVANPHTTILGHMTGRQLLRRPGYDIDIEKILQACARHSIAVEVNANPWRLDLDWRWHARALELGCVMAINPDAHSIDEIELTHWGVEMARKGGVPKDRVLNCLSLEDFTAYLQKRRNGGPFGACAATSRGRAQ